MGRPKVLETEPDARIMFLPLVLNTTDGDGVLSGQLTLAGDNLYALHLQQACKTLELTGDDVVLVIANLAHFDGL